MSAIGIVYWDLVHHSADLKTSLTVTLSLQAGARSVAVQPHPPPALLQALHPLPAVPGLLGPWLPLPLPHCLLQACGLDRGSGA